MTPDSNVRALVLGPLPPPFSGTTVSFQELVRDLTEAGQVQTTAVLNTGANKSSSALSKVVGALRLAARVIRILPKIDVVLLNASARRAVVFGAVLAFLTRVFRKPLVVRFFGGGLYDDYCGAGRAFRWCADAVFARATVLLQTHRLVEAFTARHPSSNIVWFPTSRNHCRQGHKPEVLRSSDGIVRFVYATEVRSDKGIDTLLEVFGRLDSEAVQLDVYGQLFEPYHEASADEFASWPSVVRYRGLIDSDSLRAVLGGYDGLLLPTRCQSEGYPGVIIEAFGAGVPVMTSPVGAIAEIVDESCGLLLDPLDIELWIDGISRFVRSEAMRRELAAGAVAQGARFDSTIWNGRVLGEVLTAAAEKGYAR